MQTRTTFRSSRMAAAVALAALAASASSFAAGEATTTSDTTGQNEATLALSSTYRAANGGGPLTREQVVAELRQARANGTMSMHGEAGDTPEVLAAREAFNVAQAETIVAEVVADQQRTVALAEAEIRRAQIETEAQQAQTLALSEGEELMPEGAAAADSDGSEVRIDVIDMKTSEASPANELVIVSLDGGDAAAQHARAMHVRRQLGAMGLAQDRIYVEGSSAEGDGEAVAAAEGDLEVAAINAASDDAVAAAGTRETEAAAAAEDEGS